MTKNMFLVAFVMLTFLFSFTLTTPILAQEEQQEEDIEDFSLEDLLNVEITTAGKQAEKISEIPASVVVVTRADIEKYGYQDLAEILENIPGIYQNNDYLSANFGIRGFYTADPMRNMIVLVNDIPQTNGTHSAHWMQYLNVPPEAIDRIEVVRGPMSVIYGSGAFFGAINIFTNKAEEKDGNLVSVSFGSEKTYRTTVRLSAKKDEFEYALNASYFDTEGLDVPFDQLVDNPGGFGVSAHPTTKGLLEDTSKFFNFSGKLGNVSFDASYVEARKEEMLFLPPIEIGNPSDTMAVRLGFGYEKKFSDKVRADVGFYYFRNRMLLDFNILYENFYGVQRLESAGYNAELNLFFDPSPKLNFSFGINYYKIEDFHNDYAYPFFGLDPLWHSLADGNSSKTVQSIFGQMNYKISEKLKVTVGIRLDQNPEFDIWKKSGDPEAGNYLLEKTTYSETDIEFIPRVALIYSPNNSHYFKLLYGKAINRPSLFQTMDNRFSGYFVQPLQPEDIQTIELNYIGNMSKNFQVSLSLFRNMLNNLIYRSFLTVGDELIQSQANVGELSTNGFELTLTFMPSEKFNVELSGTYQKTKDDRDEFKDVETGYSPQFLGYFKAAYSISKDVSLAINGIYVDGMESFYDHTTAARLGDSVDSRLILGANFRWKNLFGTKLYLNVKGSNLFDSDVRYATTSWGSWMTKGQVGRGMSFLFTLGMKF